eukprot:gnl/Hemi2/27778_TR9176_c0_g1_i1.p1 gnl/Hemi2/27778_TR9176_c0_g1~~gnl/Hemi2/27778_TR9176_c0_g1_i1.p1  ORF type:complete len:101 (+),score=12.56 gnl/Hemi2/27778_TR9176_c0_g1_i1:36-305(+)
MIIPKNEVYMYNFIWLLSTDLNCRPRVRDGNVVADLVFESFQHPDTAVNVLVDLFDIVFTQLPQHLLHSQVSIRVSQFHHLQELLRGKG